MEVSKEQTEMYQAIVESPLFFFEEILGEKLDAQQRPIVESFKMSRRTAIKSGHSCGKDWLTARLALWFFCAHYPAIVITTGPTERQVELVVWGELRAAYKAAKYPIGGKLLPDSPMLKTNDPDHYMVGFVGKIADAFQGFHKANVLVIMTEAQGIAPKVWGAIDSLMTAGNAKLVVIGNPSFEPASEFYQCFTSKRELYTTFTLDSRKSSYCSDEWIDEKRRIYGEDSPVYKVRVLGEWPDDVTDALIPLLWIERAGERWKTTPAEGTKTLGVDIARFGSDMTVFYEGVGDRFEMVHKKQGQDLMQTTGKIVEFIRKGISSENVRLDDTGLGGGVTDRLRELKHRPKAINFGSSASDEETYFNARSELFGELRERFREGRIAIDPNDVLLIRDLSALKYKLTSKGQLQLEAKAETKKRLGHSPDYADALALAAVPDHIAATIAAGKKSNMGILEFMRREAEKAKKTEKEAKPLTKQAVKSTPGASVLEANRERIETHYDEWRSVR